MKPFYLLCSVLTGMLGFTINQSLMWAIINGFFWPIAWVVWLITERINMSIIRQTFAFFFA